jgi:hypothetical protein
MVIFNQSGCTAYTGERVYSLDIFGCSPHGIYSFIKKEVQIAGYSQAKRKKGCPETERCCFNDVYHPTRPQKQPLASAHKPPNWNQSQLKSSQEDLKYSHSPIRVDLRVLNILPNIH